MFRNFKILTLTLILVSVFCLNGFTQSSNLVGKWVRINGPVGWSGVAAAFDEETCDKIILILRYGSWKNYDDLLDSFDILLIRNRVKAMVVDMKHLEGKAKVVILGGRDSGLSVWVPIEWLKGNEERPVFAQKYPDTKDLVYFPY